MSYTTRCTVSSVAMVSATVSPGSVLLPCCYGREPRRATGGHAAGCSTEAPVEPDIHSLTKRTLKELPLGYLDKRYAVLSSGRCPEHRLGPVFLLVLPYELQNEGPESGAPGTGQRCPGSKIYKMSLQNCLATFTKCSHTIYFLDLLSKMYVIHFTL